MRSFTTLAVLLGLGAFVDAYSPPAYKACPDNKCQKSATPYCSSYLKVPVKTTTINKTKTITTTETIKKYKGAKTVTGYPTTTYVNEKVTPTSTTKTTIETDTTITTTVQPKCTAPALLPDLELPCGEGQGQIPCTQIRRSYPVPKPYSPPKPKCFKDYSKKNDITSACKCLNIKPTTETVKKTKTVTSSCKTTTTIQKAIVTTIPVITKTKTITKPATTTTETVTKFTETVYATKTEGPLAIPTNFNVVLANPVGESLTGLEGLRGIVSTNFNTLPINFIAPLAGELVPGTTFSLSEAGGLLAQGQENEAYLSDVLGPDPQQVSYNNPLDTSTRSQLTCRIEPNEEQQTCELVCVSTPTAPAADEEEDDDDLLDLVRERRPLAKRLDVPIDITPTIPEEENLPTFVGTALVCGVDNSYNIGSGEDLATSDASCTVFTPLVVEVVPLLPAPGGSGVVPDLIEEVV